MNAAALKLAVVAGEESGDLLAADLVQALRIASGRKVELVGVGGPHLAALGLKTLFDPAEISLMGISAVLRDAPRLWRRLKRAAGAIVEAQPDCLLTVDVPDFSLRVAARAKALRPAMPVVHYVCPSVWAWRPGRAKAMRGTVDSILCLLPFEPAELARLGGPPGVFVGHRLTAEPGLASARAARLARAPLQPGGERTLLLLPGSRRAEVAALLPVFQETVALLAARGTRPTLLLPTVPRLEPTVREIVSGWPVQPQVSATAEAKWAAFASADAALAASGTVTLELALAGTPMVSVYKVDRLMRLLASQITVWTASLPNLIADSPVVPEFFNEFARPGMLARQLERLLEPSPAREAELQGLARVGEALRTDRPAGEIAAETLLGAIESAQRFAIGM